MLAQVSLNCCPERFVGMLNGASADGKQQRGKLERHGSLLLHSSPPTLVLVKECGWVDNIKLVIDVVEKYSKERVYNR